MLTWLALGWLLLAAPVAAAADDVPAATDRQRVEQLLDATSAMSAEDRALYLQALIAGDRESEQVADALQRAREVANSGGTYSDSVAAAVTGLHGPNGHSRPENTDPQVQGEEPTDVPLAIPADGTPPTVATGEIPVVKPPIDETTLARIRDYKLRHYSIRTETRYSGGGTRTFSNPYSWGGGVYVTQDPISVTRSWAVYKGPSRMDVPTYLQLTHEDEHYKDLTGRIQRTRILGYTYYGAAVAGIAAIVVGAAGVNLAEAEDEKTRWSTVGVIGVGTTIVGLIGGSLPMANARSLQTEYSRARIDIASAQAAIDAENEALRVELGLTPEQALSVEETTSKSGTTPGFYSR